MTEQEKENIKLGYLNIQKTIEKILDVLTFYKKNENPILYFYIHRFENDNSEKEIKNFLDKEKDLLSLKEYFANVLNLDDCINEQYKTFLIGSVSQYNPESMHLMHESTVNEIRRFLDKQSYGQLNITPQDVNVINWVRGLPNQYVEYISNLLDLRCKIQIFDRIKNIDGSIVMIGANGSGKSTFARQLKGKISSNIAILSAQHFLYYQKQRFISAEGNEVIKVRNFQTSNKLGSDSNFQQLIISDMNDLVSALMSEYTDCAFKKYGDNTYTESYLNKTINLWDKIVQHRSLTVERTGIYVIGKGIKKYDFNQLSDGEKAIFYYIAHVLIAQKNSYIIVDEPENHLHMTICNRLWDELEKARDDCRFIYLTHNLNFATTRSNCTIIWNKKYFPPNDWQFEILPENSVIPEVLIMELVGSRKNILFCEGENESSLDYKLYSILFDRYTVIPSKGHRNVIDYVNAYNSLESFETKAVGIIDGDYHSQDQIAKWNKMKIYTLPINEIENILCDMKVIQTAAERFCASKDAVDNYLIKFWELVDSEKEKLASNYVNQILNNKFKENFIHEKNNIEIIINELHEITSTEKIKQLYDNTINKINSFVKSKDYDSALNFVNFKGRLTKDLLNRTVVDKYQNRIIDVIKKDNNLKKYIIDKYFSKFENLDENVRFNVTN